MPGAPLRILHVFSTFAVGGPQMRFAQLVPALGDGFRHKVIATDDRHAAAAALPQDAPVEIANCPVKKGDGLGRFAAIARTLAAERPDLLVTYNWGAIEWALINRLTPICRHLHCEDGFGPEEAAGRQIPRRVWFRRLALTGKTQILLPSQTLCQVATQRWRLSPGRLHLVPNGVDLRRFSADAAIAPAVPREPDRITIAAIGGLRPEKDLGTLIAALAHTHTRSQAGQPALRLLIAGDGAERDKLEALAAQQGVADRVRFLGQVARPETVLAAADIYAMSSLTEQMPISLVEAMAMRQPVAATDVGDIRHMLAEPNRAYLSAPGDASGLAAHLAALAGDAALRQRLGAANRARTEAEYDEAVMVARWRSLLSGEAHLRNEGSK